MLDDNQSDFKKQFSKSILPKLELLGSKKNMQQKLKEIKKVTFEEKAITQLQQVLITLKNKQKLLAQALCI